MVQNSYQQFVDAIASFRGLSTQAVRDTQAGIFFGRQGVDAGLIDGIVNGVGARCRDVGSVLRLLQSGSIRSYATWVLFGSVALILAMGLFGGLPR